MKTDQIEQIAHLARLQLTAAEKERFAGQLAAILEYFSRLQEVSPGVDGTSASPTAPPLRPDVPRTFPDAERLVYASADHADSYFRVPRVM